MTARMTPAAAAADLIRTESPRSLGLLTFFPTRGAKRLAAAARHSEAGPGTVSLPATLLSEQRGANTCRCDCFMKQAVSSSPAANTMSEE